MEEYQKANFLESILIIIVLIIIVPILFVLLLIIGPYFTIHSFFQKRKRKKELKQFLEENNNKIYLIYNQHNYLDFKTYYNNQNKDIECIREGYYNSKNTFLHYLPDVSITKCPKLVKIKNKEIITKEHFNSYRHYVKRNNNPEAFFELLNSSIKNLENEKL
ncbi:hypothetical protein [uncultured Tenacibaculum sp.]|uniref:hypothetical protein n=1 Tax=uncultured Tenacibaculum sp. TaxID=174713 RepID=UPI00262A47FC|nr:hypothetical protein [uncultured Tenacibaculum sp.]